MDEYFDVWAVWLDGNSTSGMVLWGLKVLWWGRLGKGLLILAGSIAVVDVLSQRWLRAVGGSLEGRARRSSARGSDRAALRRITRLRRSIELDFVVDRGFATTAWTAVTWSELVTRPPIRVRKELGLTLEEYRDQHRRAVDQVQREHTCAGPHDSLCSEQCAYLDRVVDGLLPPEDRALLARIKLEEAESAGPSLLGLIFGLMPVFMVGFFLFLAGAGRENVLLMLVGGVIIAAVLGFERLLLWVAPALHRLRSLVEHRLGLQLRMSPPLRWFRVLALFAFAAGAHFDLIAS